MMFKHLLLVCVVLCFNLTYSQDSAFKYSGKVVDLNTKKPLPNVSVQIEGSLRGSSTDSSGKFEILVKGAGELLKFSLIGYEAVYLNPHKKNYRKNLIGLNPKAVEITEVVVKAKTIEIIAKSNRSYVLDYDFYSDNILMITYNNLKTGNKILLLNEKFDTLGIATIPEEPLKLFKDCLGNHHVVCEKTVYQVYYDGKTLRFLPPKSVNDFENILLPCIAMDSTNFYTVTKSGSYVVSGVFHDFNSNHTGLAYSFINKQAKIKVKLIDIIDEEAIRMKADERSGLSHKTNFQKNYYDILFTETIVFKEIFAPLYIIKNKIYVFDFINSRLQNFTASGKIINEAKMTLHKNLEWKRQMYIDEKTDKAYTLFESKGISELKEINLVTGKENGSKKIPLVFVDNIKVRGNYIYFIHKETGFDDTNYLSRMKLD